MGLAAAERALMLTGLRAYAPLGIGLLLGSGTFRTPNTSSIMVSVAANRRGIANGICSMLQNTGHVTGAAPSLSIVTSPLMMDSKQAVYSGPSATSRHRIRAR